VPELEKTAMRPRVSPAYRIAVAVSDVSQAFLSSSIKGNQPRRGEGRGTIERQGPSISRRLLERLLGRPASRCGPKAAATAEKHLRTLALLLRISDAVRHGTVRRTAKSLATFGSAPPIY
jgi:hypothetical protein